MLAFRLEQTGREGIGLEQAGGQLSSSAASQPMAIAHERQAFLRIPPFPGARPGTFALGPIDSDFVSDAAVDALLDNIRSLKVGGSYWGTQPPLPQERYVLVRTGEAAVGGLSSVEPVLRWVDSQTDISVGSAAPVVAGVCDPWHLLSGASRVVVDSDDELALIAAVAGTPVECVGPGRFESLEGNPARAVLRDVFRQHVLDATSYLDPYSSEPRSFADALRTCGFFRQLIDSNRDIQAAVGFAFWKRPTVGPLLWRGLDQVPFVTGTDAVGAGDRVALWRARTPPRLASDLEDRGAKVIEAEDGFIRSAGLGADCVPPLSIVLDRRGPHFDPNQPSELEALLEDGDFPGELLDRARNLRELIVTSGISKYSAGHAPLQRRAPGRRHILVPGQVEDDRAVLVGGAGLTSNLELLRRVRAEAPDAHLIYKPHPDVEAGHRKGAIADDVCRSVADEVVRNEPITALIDLVDEVHVNTSLAGFEALLRQKVVTTHGVPFYSGWGLTRDLGPVPERRTARRTLDELVAAALLLYPRYLDPVSGLPCSAEILVRRLAESVNKPSDGILVMLRRLQGRCRRALVAVWNRR